MSTPAHKKITLAQIKACADSLGVPLAAMRAVHSVESKGEGFLSTGEPVILFEPHIFYKQLTKKGLLDIRAKVMRERPDLCYPKWKPKSYGAAGIYQHQRLTAASQYHRESALESASWGLGQVMGFNWKDLGYPTLQAFINAQYKDEGAQLDTMCRFIRQNKLVDALKNKDWAAFAYKYNGEGYKANNYHGKLAAAFKKFNA